MEAGAVRHMDEATPDAYGGRLRHDPGVRRDLARLIEAFLGESADGARDGLQEGVFSGD